ncbi:NAD-glutamate dehydrogenase [Marinicella litoralis]|uniref:Glutamate dehydrogenase (NAD) n=1 Tax=Marinicella litoralis TaxID=644220 RepID=A0A4R6XE00_9GAMM|nr:NAD-glutamate dehydrogenase [Marinicella litoralis]TDR17546.1 glutamate dehydrogenase (NAD) [Marinicella litoralis]
MQSLLTAEHKKFIKKFSKHINQCNAPFSDSIKQLGKQLFTHMSMDEIKSHELNYWYQTISDMIKSMSVRRLKNPIIEVNQSEVDSSVSQIFLVNDNIPFLVDSATMACAEFGLTVKLISHPIIEIKGEDNQRVLIDKSQKGETEAKSLIYIEVKRLESKKEAQALQNYLDQVFSQIRQAVNDWQPMLDAINQAKQAIGVLDNEKVRSEQQAFIDWLVEDNFTFLGYRKYNRKKDQLMADAKSGLGLLSSQLDADGNDASQLSVDSYQIKKQSDLVVITKVNVISKIHRKGNLDYIGLLETNNKGEVIAEHRFIGLFTSVASNTNALKIPYINSKIKVLIRQFGFDSQSHSGKMLMHIINTMPRDEVLQSNTKELFHAVYQSLVIQEKITTQVTARRDKFNRFCSFMVYVPRDLFNTNTRHKIQSLLASSVGGVEVEYAVAIDDSHYARLYVVIRDITQFNETILENIKTDVIDIVTTWEDKLAAALKERLGQEESLRMMDKFKGSFPVAYTEDVSPWVASYDVENADKVQNENDIEMSLYEPRIKRQGDFRFKVFRFHNTIPLSEVLPDLENLGLHVVSERPYELKINSGQSIWIQDFDLNLASGKGLELDLVKTRFHEAFGQVVNGELESDPLNKLIILGGLTWRQINFLRGVVKYLLQTGLPYSKDYIEKAMIQHPHISRWLVELFTIKFSPKLDHVDTKEVRAYLDKFSEKFSIQCNHLNVELTQYQQDCVDKYIRSRKFARDTMADKVVKVITALLDTVKSQDEDRIIRYVVDTINAMLRTNFYQTEANGDFKPAISMKFNSSELSFLPKPVPFREIFVYSPRVEAIHLRMGKVARGGLRWSDRYEDFRTEVLGLMKAQNVKNAIIVPVGSKGGFVVKNLPNGSRDEVMAEVVSCYKIFIGSMLDITDNIKGKRIVAPKNVVRHDEDDPYLVVAADKGTATFSDIANGISEARGFWLGDAFASGGSAGYDHKGMGITARGAWESVKRHFRELGVDCQTEDFSVVGIGDMMGDVFGNGMLLSKHICLKAAFNHMHIFLDPKPDSASSWKERNRLFKLPRSSWEDYDASLISKGGGVYARSDKSIPISPEVKAWLKVKEDELAPQELINRLLLSEVDLIWNGGIGTYVKASNESHSDAGDSANNALRVDGKQLKCKVFGEGGNLGMTQEGRIEFANNGGKVNTDFIDNSAGVDCSDHEVNIKILLKAMMEDDLYDMQSRNKLLASMTDDVSELVLKNNYMQTQTLSFMSHLSANRVGAKAHLIRSLEAKGLLDRDIEFLPNDAELERRRKSKEGLTRPELCVLLSYSKLDLYDQVIGSNVLDDPWLRRLMINYFPEKLQQVDDKYLDNHRLKREIIGTILTSQIIDRMGATFVMRMQEDTGADVGAICQAFYIVTELFNLNDLWHGIESQDGKVEFEKQIEAFVAIWKFVRQTIRWVLNNLGHNLDIAKHVNDLSKGVSQFRKDFAKYISDTDRVSMERVINALSKQKFAKNLAHDIAALPYLSAALDVVMVANEQGVTVKKAADMYFPLGKMLNLIWLQNMIEKLKVSNQWHVHARGGLRDDLSDYHAQLTSSLLKRYGKKQDSEKSLTQWNQEFGQKVKNVKDMMSSIKVEKQIDYPTIMVAINTLSHLVAATK